EIAIAAHAIHPPQQRSVARPGLAVCEARDVAGRQGRILDAFGRADRDAFTVEECAATARRPGFLAEHRRARHADNDFAVQHQRDLRGEERIAAHEALGTIDGIHQPAEARVRLAARAELLAEEGVLREAFRYRL